MFLTLFSSAEVMAAAIRSYHDRRNMGVATAARAYHGRRTMALSPKIKIPCRIRVRGIRRIRFALFIPSQHGKRNMVTHCHKANGHHKQETGDDRQRNVDV